MTRQWKSTSKSYAVSAVAALFAFVFAIFLVAGCKQGRSPDSFPTEVQVFNAVASSDTLKISVDSKDLADGIDYAGGSGYKGIDPGHYLVGIAAQSSAFGSNTLYPYKFDASPDVKYTAIAYGVAGPGHEPLLTVFDSPKSSENADPDKASVRVFNAAAGTEKLDFLINSIVAFKGVSYGTRSDVIPLAALPYEWTAKVSGDGSDTLMDPITLSLKGGKSYLVVVLGNVADHDLTIKAIEQ